MSASPPLRKPATAPTEAERNLLYAELIGRSRGTATGRASQPMTLRAPSP